MVSCVVRQHETVFQCVVWYTYKTSIGFGSISIRSTAQFVYMYVFEVKFCDSLSSIWGTHIMTFAITNSRKRDKRIWCIVDFLCFGFSLSRTLIFQIHAFKSQNNGRLKFPTWQPICRSKESKPEGNWDPRTNYHKHPSCTNILNYLSITCMHN